MFDKTKRNAGKAQTKLITLAQEIKKKFRPQKVILFGSYAYGDPTRGSDIDFLVIMNTNLPLREQAFLIRKELKESIPIDVIVRTPQQIEERLKLGDFFIKEIVQKGVVL